MLYSLVCGVGSTPSDARIKLNEEVGILTRKGWYPHGDHTAITTTNATGATREVVFSQVMLNTTEEDAKMAEEMEAHRAQRRSK